MGNFCVGPRKNKNRNTANATSEDKPTTGAEHKADIEQTQYTHSKRKHEANTTTTNTQAHKTQTQMTADTRSTTSKICHGWHVGGEGRDRLGWFGFLLDQRMRGNCFGFRNALLLA